MNFIVVIGIKIKSISVVKSITGRCSIYYHSIAFTFEFITSIKIRKTIKTHYTIIPNIITPNGDGINEVFYIESKLFVDAQVKIYNRWGILIYEWSGINGGWNGKINGDGTDANAGVYYYMAELMDSKGTTSIENGFLELLR
jgi:gliding motility-associated-like protein